MSFAIGIDPSLTATGIAPQHGTPFTVRSKADGDQRLHDIDQAIRTETALRPTLAIIEDLPTHAHGAGTTGMVQGVIRLALIHAEVPYITVPAATLKKFATGKGNATKPDMRMALFQRADLDLRDDNQVDAWWLREIGRQALGDPLTIQLPKSQREAILKLDWPVAIAARLLEPYERLVTDGAT